MDGKANDADLAAVAKSGDYNDLINAPDAPDIPEDGSAFIEGDPVGDKFEPLTQPESGADFPANCSSSWSNSTIW